MRGKPLLQDFPIRTAEEEALKVHQTTEPDDYFILFPPWATLLFVFLRMRELYLLRLEKLHDCSLG